MKYEVTTKLYVTGTFTVEADSPEQAEEYVQKHCGLVIGGDIHSTLPEEDIDWNFPVHFEKEITQVEPTEPSWQRHRELFVRWVEINHGSHEHILDEDCDIYLALHDFKNGTKPFEYLLETVQEVDDGWQESWETFMEVNNAE